MVLLASALALLCCCFVLVLRLSAKRPRTGDGGSQFMHLIVLEMEVPSWCSVDDSAISGAVAYLCHISEADVWIGVAPLERPLSPDDVGTSRLSIYISTSSPAQAAQMASMLKSKLVNRKSASEYLSIDCSTCVWMHLMPCTYRRQPCTDLFASGQPNVGGEEGNNKGPRYLSAYEMTEVAVNLTAQKTKLVKARPAGLVQAITDVARGQGSSSQNDDAQDAVPLGPSSSTSTRV